MRWVDSGRPEVLESRDRRDWFAVAEQCLDGTELGRIDALDVDILAPLLAPAGLALLHVLGDQVYVVDAAKMPERSEHWVTEPGPVEGLWVSRRREERS